MYHCAVSEIFGFVDFYTYAALLAQRLMLGGLNKDHIEIIDQFQIGS